MVQCLTQEQKSNEKHRRRLIHQVRDTPRKQRSRYQGHQLGPGDNGNSHFGMPHHAKEEERRMQYRHLINNKGMCTRKALQLVLLLPE